MPIDASIPLAAGNIRIGPDPQQLMSLMQFSQQMRAQQQAQQRQNMLRDIFANPSSFDQTGAMTPEATQRLMMVDPQTGLKVRQEATTERFRQSEIERNQAALAEARQKTNLELARAGTDQILKPAMIAYDEAIKRGVPEPQARQVFSQEYTNRRKQVGGSGLIPEDRLPPAGMNPEQARGNLQTYEQYVAREEERKRDETAAKRQAETARHDVAMEEARARAEERADRRLNATLSKIGGAEGKPPAGYRWSKDKPGELEPIPGGPATKSGTTIAGKMNPTMLASVKLDMKEIEYGLDQIEKLKTDKASAFFSDPHEGNAITRFLKRRATPEQQQEYDALANRFAVSIASIQSMGRGQISDAKIAEAKKLIPVIGDEKGTVDIKLKTIRRIVKLAQESLDTPLKGGDRTPADDVQDAVDFSPMFTR